MPVYSWMETSLQLQLPEDVAESCNRIADILAELAPDEVINSGTILADANPDDLGAWNKFAEIVNLILELNGGSIQFAKTEGEQPSFHLVRVQDRR